MKIELTSDDVYDILNDWCLKEHGSDIDMLVFKVENNAMFEGVFLRTGFSQGEK